MSEAPGLRVVFRGAIGGFALDAAFTAPGAGVIALFGPSGCGKTSVLRCVAGLRRIADGFCAIEGDIWQNAATFRPPHAREIGYVFQEANLFPHLNVRRNLLYGACGGSRGEVGFDETVALLGLDALLERAPRNLSGGERQRVAIGRALLSRPRLILMDEPFSALDRAAKDEILPLIQRLRERLSIPILYVSHDLSEVERLADHIVLMEQGRVRASGPLAAIQSDPALPLAAARDAAVSLAATVESYDEPYGLLEVSALGGRFWLPAQPLPAGSALRLRIEAGAVSLAREPPQASTILNAAAARILSATPLGGAELIVALALGEEGAGARLLARVTRKSWDALALNVGALVHAQVKSVSLAALG